MDERLWRGFIGTLGCLVRRPAPNRRLLCHACALDTHNRLAFNQLLYHVRGKRVCEKCGRKFTVTFTPNATAHVRAVASNVEQLVGDLKRSCDNCGYKVPEKTRLASQPKCERPIDNMDDACHNFAKWIPNNVLTQTGK